MKRLRTFSLRNLMLIAGRWILRFSQYTIMVLRGGAAVPAKVCPTRNGARAHKGLPPLPLIANCPKLRSCFVVTGNATNRQFTTDKPNGSLGYIWAAKNLDGKTQQEAHK